MQRADFLFLNIVKTTCSLVLTCLMYAHSELLDALCIASPIAPYVNSIVKPMDKMSKVLELRMAVTWYFRLRPRAADDIAKALGWDTTDGTLEAFLLGLGKLDLDMDKANAKVSNSAV
ncbi:hypothetical protein QFC22_004395 [Naganishia vaughanmartiniae]|uniref:Uncharacterized protein n=1 Tax=Naganishia vaughanmartiniae TaxID=1424756 RepID=A0ACC2X1U0_9TREE|nr:hypothetical protein QFC22_004395 [Naganishia vaughanmartiniae]